MHISQKGIDLIKQFEGFRATPYRCSARKKTIGYGHVMKKGENMLRINKIAAETLLKHDIKIAEMAINSFVAVKITQGQYDALVSLVYNWGATRFKRSTGLKRLNASTARIEFFSKERGVNKVKGKFSAGLHRRRQAELRLWNAAA